MKGVTRMLRKGAAAVELTGFFLYELVLANLKLARDMLRPLRELQPGVVAVPLEPAGPWQVTILANLLTLTPGSLSVDVSPRGDTIYVHVMDARDPDRVRRLIKQGFERRVKEVFS